LTAGAANAPGGSRFFGQGILPIDRARIPSEVVAGVTLAALAIPEVMGYTKIAGTPVITGLYTLLIPMALYALFGSSRHLVVAADSATAAIMAATLAGLAAIESPEYVVLAGALAIITGGFLFIARLIRLGFLADFLSRTVLIGFLTGVGIQVAAGQISGMLGLPGGGPNTIPKLVNDVKQLGEGDLSTSTMFVSLLVLVVIAGSKRFLPRIPGALIAVVGMIIASYAFDFAGRGISTLGPVPGGLPRLGIPTINPDQLETLLATAFSCFLVILAQSAATSRAYAARYSERFQENTDLVGLALANVGAGLSGTFLVNGSPTKTQMVDGAGGRSQLAQITTIVIVILVLLFLTAPLSYMPTAVLSTVVFIIGVELVDLKGMRKIYRLRTAEFVVALITAATVVLVGVEQAILLAMVLSLIEHVRRGYRPKNAVLVPDDTGGWRMTPLTSPAQAAPGLVVYRFNHSLYYANAEKFSEEARQLSGTGPEPVSWFCVAAAAVDDIDISAAEALGETIAELKERSIKLVIAEISPDVRAELDRYGTSELVGEGGYFATINEVVAAFRKATAA
jgi:high affinity sulfate transporter 1